jgi:hypothetical protein
LSGPPPADKSVRRLSLVAALILAGIGLIMSLQSVSLFTGTGKVWTGAALTMAAVALAAVMVRRAWLIIVLVLVAALAIGSAVYDQHQLNDRRRQIEQLVP